MAEWAGFSATLQRAVARQKNVRAALVVPCNEALQRQMVASGGAASVACLPNNGSFGGVPRGRRFDLVVVTASWVEEQEAPARSLRRFQRRLLTGATVIVETFGAIAAAGLDDARKLLDVLGADDGLRRTLLNALPAHNALRRQPASVQLAVQARLLNSRLQPLPPPSRAQPRRSGLTVLRFLEELCATDFLSVRRLEAPRRARLPAHTRLDALSRRLPWAAAAQFYELWGGTLTHVVATARARGGGAPSCGEGVARDLAELRRTLGTLDCVLAGEMSDRSSCSAATAAVGAPAAIALVSEQYEALPFPPRRAADELTRPVPIHSSLASLAEISHHAFGGRLGARFCAIGRPFRALVAGGGTGDATVQLAHELAELHASHPGCGYSGAEVVHLDLSASSIRLAAARLHARGLRARLVRGSILDVARLDLGRFDFINLCGVLHHLPVPSAALAILRQHALQPQGAIGMMVYGTLGRRGVYETQAMLRLLHAAGNASRPWPIGARVADAFELLASLPATSPLRLNRPVWASDELQGRMGDAGVFDLLLHATDRPFTRRRLVQMARGAGLRAVGWVHPSLYDPRYWLRQPPCTEAHATDVPAASDAGTSACGNDARARWRTLRSSLDDLEREDGAEVAELASGHIRKHWLYLAPEASPNAAAA